MAYVLADLVRRCVGAPSPTPVRTLVAGQQRRGLADMAARKLFWAAFWQAAVRPLSVAGPAVLVNRAGARRPADRVVSRTSADDAAANTRGGAPSGLGVDAAKPT